MWIQKGNKMKTGTKRIIACITALIMLFVVSTANFAYAPIGGDGICVEPHTHTMSAWTWYENHEGDYRTHYFYKFRYCTYPYCMHTEMVSYNSYCTATMCNHIM